MATKDGAKTGGRTVGTPNKRTWEARAIAERLGFDPLEMLIHWARGDWQALGYASGQKEVVTADGQKVKVDRIDEALRQKSVKDVVPYLYPQLKTVELTGDAAQAAAFTLTQLIAATAKKQKEEQAPNVGDDTEPAAGAGSA